MIEGARLAQGLCQGSSGQELLGTPENCIFFSSSAFFKYGMKTFVLAIKAGTHGPQPVASPGTPPL